MSGKIEIEADKLADEIYGLCCDIGRLEVENARLRKMIESVPVLKNDPVYKRLDAITTEICGKSFTEQARELGVET